jgi:hypothetical protein
VTGEWPSAMPCLLPQTTGAVQLYIVSQVATLTHVWIRAVDAPAIPRSFFLEQSFVKKLSWSSTSNPGVREHMVRKLAAYMEVGAIRPCKISHREKNAGLGKGHGVRVAPSLR